MDGERSETLQDSAVGNRTTLALSQLHDWLPSLTFHDSDAPQNPSTRYILIMLRRTTSSPRCRSDSRVWTIHNARHLAELFANASHANDTRKEEI